MDANEDIRNVLYEESDIKKLQKDHLLTVHHTEGKSDYTWQKSDKKNSSKAYLDFIFTRNVEVTRL